MRRVLLVAWQRLSGAGLGGCNVSFCRGICTGFQRLQGLTERTASVAPEVTKSQRKSEFSLFPPVRGQESSLTWGGKKYEDIPIAHIKATHNNTHIQVLSPQNFSIVRASCGTEGFKNAKKSSAIAAQTTGIAVAAKACKKGVSHVRVVVKGLGQGRVSAIKGLTMGGLEIISITDDTPVPHNGCRPQKASAQHCYARGVQNSRLLRLCKLNSCSWTRQLVCCSVQRYCEAHWGSKECLEVYILKGNEK